jgi:hypothetical protein
MTSLPSNYADYRSSPTRRLVAALVKTSEHHVYECPASMSCTILSMWIASTHSGAVLIRVHHCRAGETPALSNALLYDASIAAKTTTVYDAPIVMSGGDRIFLRADSTDKLCVTLYGAEA